MSEQAGAGRVLLVGGGECAAAAADRLSADGYGVERFAADVTPEDLEAAGKAGEDPYALVIVVEPGGGAGTAWDGSWCAAVAATLRAAFLQTKALARQIMRARRGRILYVVGACGLSGEGADDAWVVASGGVAGMARTVARELAGRSVTVNTIAYGPGDDGGAPLGHGASADEVAAACSYLLSAEAASVTGQVLTVDGGRVMR